MQDVCSELKQLEFSPGLKLIFNKHFNRVYIYHWFYGFVQEQGSKPLIERRIIDHYDEYFNREIHNHDRGSATYKRLVKFHSAVKEFIRDFRKLSFADVDFLRTLKYKSFKFLHEGDYNGVNEQLIKYHKMEVC